MNKLVVMLFALVLCLSVSGWAQTGAGAIAGQATKADGGTALADATILAFQADDLKGSATTDMGGNYTLANLPAGKYDVKADADGFSAQTQSVRVDSGMTATVNFALAAAMGVIAGQVTKTSDGAPLAGATVQASQEGVMRSAATDADGNYTIDNLSPGTYDVTVSATGFTRQVRRVAANAGTTSVRNFSLDTVPPGASAGRVTASDGQVIRDAMVEARQRGVLKGSARTGADGNYRIGDLAAGTYTLAVSAPDYVQQARDVSIASAATATANFSLEPAGVIAGQVVRPDGTPVRGAIVRARSSRISRAARTGTDGSYRITQLPSGSYYITTIARGLATTSLRRNRATVTPRTTTTVRLPMQTAPPCDSGARSNSEDAGNRQGSALNGASSVIVEPGPSVKFEEVEFLAPEDTVDRPDLGRVRINIPAIYKETGICTGYLNVYADAGWIIQNVLADCGSEFPTVSSYFSFGSPARADADLINAYVVFSPDPMPQFTDGPRSLFHVLVAVWDAQGVGGPVTEPDEMADEAAGLQSIAGSMGGPIDFDPDGPTVAYTQWSGIGGDGFVQPGEVNEQAANNQCFPMAVANSLQYLKNVGQIDFLAPHRPGLKYEFQRTLVGEMDRLSDRPVRSRLSGQGTPTYAMLFGKLKFMAGNVPGSDLLTYEHQGRGWATGQAGEPNLLPNGDITLFGLTSQDGGGAVTWQWLCDQVQQGAGVEIGFSFDDANGRPRGGHAVHLFACGMVGGQPWIGYLHDRVQTDLDPQDCRGLEPVFAYTLGAADAPAYVGSRAQKIRVALSVD